MPQKEAIVRIKINKLLESASWRFFADAGDRDFLYWSLAGKYQKLRTVSESRGGNQCNLNAQLIRNVKIRLPDLAPQRAIVAKITTDQTLVSSNRELNTLFEGKIRATIDRVWSAA